MMKRSDKPVNFRLAPKRGEQGSSIVETAVSMIVLLVALIGIMEMCLALYTYHFLSDAAREGTRYAIVRGSSLGAACASPGYATCIAQNADIQTYIYDLNLPGIRPSAMTVNTTWPSTTNCSPSATPCNNPGNLVKVTVNYKFPLIIPFFKISNLNMSSTSEMVISQ